MLKVTSRFLEVMVDDDAFTRAGITGGAQVEKKDDEFGFDMLTLRGLRDVWTHMLGT